MAFGANNASPADVDSLLYENFNDRGVTVADGFAGYLVSRG